MTVQQLLGTGYQFVVSLTSLKVKLVPRLAIANPGFKMMMRIWRLHRHDVPQQWKMRTSKLCCFDVQTDRNRCANPDGVFYRDKLREDTAKIAHFGISACERARSKSLITQTTASRIMPSNSSISTGLRSTFQVPASTARWTPSSPA